MAQAAHLNMMEKAQDSGHIRALDGIRGMALIFVFIYHALNTGIDPNGRWSRFLQHAAETGWIGVDVFFVLSGFLITTILLKARSAQNYYTVFYVRRALRIFPMYYLVVFLSLWLMPSHFSVKQQLFYWLNLSNLPTAFRPLLIPFLAHLWSLAIEEQFYLVWPSLVRWLQLRALAIVCGVVVMGLFVTRNLPAVLSFNATWPEAVYRLTPFRIDTLCAGAMLAILIERGVNLARYRMHLRALCVLSGGIFLYVGFGRIYTNIGVIRFGYTSLLLCSASLIALALSPKGVTTRFFSMSVLRQTGKYSYSFYLLHPFVVNYIASHLQLVHRGFNRLGIYHVSNNVMILLTVAAEFVFLFGVCALLWEFFESQILRLKRHSRYRPASMATGHTPSR